jgi:hypothetical protein
MTKRQPTLYNPPKPINDRSDPAVLTSSLVLVHKHYPQQNCAVDETNNQSGFSNDITSSVIAGSERSKQREWLVERQRQRETSIAGHLRLRGGAQRQEYSHDDLRAATKHWNMLQFNNQPPEAIDEADASLFDPASRPHGQQQHF